MTALTALILDNAEVLRALDAGGFGAIADLARKFDRDPDNFRKTLKRLERDGLVVVDADGPHPLPVLSAGGREALAALQRAEDPASTLAAPIEGIAALLHLQIHPDPLNPRKHFDDESLAELADSIAQDGLLENLVVRTGETDLGGDITASIPVHRLVAGERRWRAIRRLIVDGRWPADRRILCKVVEIDDAAHRRLALVENLQRKDLRPIDEAEALQALMDVTKQGTAEVAQEIGFTQRFVQQRLQLLKMPPAKREALNAGTITVEEARRWIAARPKLLENLTPHQELVLLEVAWEVAKTSNGWWTSVPCDWRARLDTEAAALLIEPGDENVARHTLRLLNISSPQPYMQDPRTTVTLASPAYGHLITLTGADDKLTRAELEPHLKRARTLAIGGSPLAADYDPMAFKQVDALFKAKRHVTPWLNGPFEIDPEIKTKAELRATQQAQDEAENAEERERQLAHVAAQAAKIQAAEAAAVAVLRGFQANDWDAAAMKQVFADLGAPLPWTWRDDPEAQHSWDSDAGMLDAEGRPVDGFDGLPIALARLVMAAMNAAVDEPPLIELSDQDEPGDGGGEDPDDGDDAPDPDQVTFLDDEEAEALDAASAEPDPPLPSYLTRLTAPAGAQP